MVLKFFSKIDRQKFLLFLLQLVYQDINNVSIRERSLMIFKSTLNRKYNIKNFQCDLSSESIDLVYDESEKRIRYQINGLFDVFDEGFDDICLEIEYEIKKDYITVEQLIYNLRTGEVRRRNIESMNFNNI